MELTTFSTNSPDSKIQVFGNEQTLYPESISQIFLTGIQLFANVLEHDNSQLVRMWNKRLRGYKAMGYNVSSDMP